MVRTKKRTVELRPGTVAWVLVQVEEARVGETTEQSGLYALSVGAGGCDGGGVIDLLARAIPFAHAAAMPQDAPATT